MNEQADPIPPQSGKKAKSHRLWPTIIVGLLAAHTTFILIVVYIATSDPSEAVIAHYHEKALAWDQHQARERASAALGWACSIDAALSADMLGDRSVRISLKDDRGQPLIGAKVSLEAYAHARANDISVADFNEGAPGEYVAMVPMRRSGLWHFDIKALRDKDTFLHHEDRMIGPSSAHVQVPDHAS